MLFRQYFLKDTNQNQKMKLSFVLKCDGKFIAVLAIGTCS